MSKQTYTVSGSELVDRVKQVIHEGNVRRVRLIHDGRPLIDIPMTIGVPAAVITVLTVPVLAALGAIAALITECTLEIERTDMPPEDRHDPGKNRPES